MVLDSRLITGQAWSLTQIFSVSFFTILNHCKKAYLCSVRDEGKSETGKLKLLLIETESSLYTSVSWNHTIDNIEKFEVFDVAATIYDDTPSRLKNSGKCHSINSFNLY